MRRRRLLLTLILLVPAPVVLGARAGAAHTPVSVYPAAGTTTANPRSQISFRGVGPHGLHGIKVVGSHSGRHSGHLEAHSDGRGASFLLDGPLAPAETVMVRANQPLVGAGRDGKLVFKTSAPVKGLSQTPPDDAGGFPDQAQHFRSEPDLLPPSIQVLREQPSAASGDIFTSPKIKKGQDGAMITDERGRLVWFHRAPRGRSIYDFRAQTYRGKPVLTWWEGRILFGKGIGKGQIYDASYRRLATVRAANGYKNDEHEFELTPRGTALITIAVPVTYDLRSVGGPKHGAVYDSAVQEVDVKTGLVVFEWHGIGRIPFTESYERYHRHRKAPYDPFHVNSIDERPNGNLVISARNSDAAYELSRRTAAIRWRLGGKRSSFRMGPGSRFVGQHDVRRHSDGTVTVFDNGAGIREQGFRPARGAVLRVDGHTRTTTLLHSLTRSAPTVSASQGNVERLPDGHYFVGWGGTTPYMSEFDHRGKLVFDASFEPAENNSYRAYRFPWRAHPAYPPAVAAAHANGQTRAWASWNGATDVARWELLGGAMPSAMIPVALADRAGFETELAAPGELAYVAVRALAAGGAALGTSRIVAVSSGQPRRG